jgi:hypothetical protein
MTPILAMLLAAAQPVAPAPDAPPTTLPTPGCTPSGRPAQGRIARMLAEADGSGADKAWRVRNIREEYQLVDALGLCPGGQSLMMNGNRPYDVLRAIDPRTGAERELWFDISSFYGRAF